MIPPNPLVASHRYSCNESLFLEGLHDNEGFFGKDQDVPQFDNFANRQAISQFDPALDSGTDSSPYDAHANTYT